MKNKKLIIITAAALCLVIIAIILLLSTCGNAGNIVGKWKTRPIVDENGEVVAVSPEEIQLFEFLSSGEGSQSLPEYGETEIMSFKWKTSGKTLTITESDGKVHKFTYKVDGHVLSITRKGNDRTFEYIKVS